MLARFTVIGLDPMTRCKRLCLAEQVVDVLTLLCIKYFGDLDCKYLYRRYLNLKLYVRKQSWNNML